MIKFYIGEMSSHYDGNQEVHVIERIDCLLYAETEQAAKYLGDLLRAAHKDYIRSDNTRTVMARGFRHCVDASGTG